MNFIFHKKTRKGRVKSFQIVPLRSFYIPMPLGGSSEVKNESKNSKVHNGDADASRTGTPPR